MFEMNIVDLEQIVGRVDRFSFNLNLYDCLRLFSEFMLLSIGISKRFKWYGKLIDQHFPNLGLRIGAIIVENDQKKSLDLLKELRVYHREVLSERGFSQRELNDWSNCNLDRFLFQRF
jgi:hypothetical protein